MSNLARARAEAKTRYLTRRCCLYLGVDIPQDSALRYVQGKRLPQPLPPDYVPSAQEMTIIRKITAAQPRAAALQAPTGYPGTPTGGLA